MTLEHLVNLYFIGAIVTAFGNSGHKYHARRMVLWPLYWCYCLALFLIEVRNALADLRRRYW